MGSYVSIGITATFTGDDSGVLTAELLDITCDAEKTDQIDVTHQGSTDGYREFEVGLIDAQSVTLTLNFDSDNVRPAAKEKGTLVITLPFSSATLKTCTMPVNVEESRNVDAALGQKMAEQIKFKVTGKKVWT